MAEFDTSEAEDGRPSWPATYCSCLTVSMKRLAMRPLIGQWLIAERGLRLKHPQARILSCHGHLDALGYRIRRCGVTALK